MVSSASVQSGTQSERSAALPAPANLLLIDLCNLPDIFFSFNFISHVPFEGKRTMKTTQVKQIK